jgi:hypothetical protein
MTTDNRLEYLIAHPEACGTDVQLLAAEVARLRGRVRLLEEYVDELKSPRRG